MHKLSNLKLALALAAVTLAAGPSCLAQSLSDVSVKPTAATANSIFLFKVTWDRGSEDNEIQTLTLKVAKIEVSCPLPTEAGEWKVEVKVSGGLALMYDPCPEDPSILYCSGLRAKEYDPDHADDYGKPDDVKFTWTAEYTDSEGETQTVSSSEGTVTVHDSFYFWPAGSFSPIDKYGGVRGDRDFLTSYPFQWPNKDVYIDPLHVTPYVEQFPDDGTSSSDYTFRIHYINVDNSAPVPWLEWGDDVWAPSAERHERTGVMLYLDRADVAVPGFKPHFMYREDYEDVSYGTEVGVKHILRVVPVGDTILRSGGDDWICTWPYRRPYETGPDGIRRWPYYVALSPGVYHYFFACSDDDISQADNPSGLDDKSPYRPASSTYSQYDPFYGSHQIGFNTGLYLDKPTYFPGRFFPFLNSLTYLYDSWAWGDAAIQTHPRVDPGLGACFENGRRTISGLNVYEYPLGGSRFLGTLYPYRSAVNPMIANQGSWNWRMWAESAAVSASTLCEFRVVYKQSQGKPPVGVWLCMNNGNFANPYNPTAPTKYEMKSVHRDSDPSADEIKNGVVYKVTLNAGQKLGTGPHYYWFEAGDGTRVCHYPRRPDEIIYNGGTFNDYYVPKIEAPDPLDPLAPWLPVDNDVINGPYVNNKPVLSGMSLTPGSGVAGTDFVFRVTYSDADGQRPYTAYLVIKPEGSATEERYSMQKGAGTDYITGVQYYLNTASLAGLALKPGVTYTHRFEFTDDWGRQTDPNDLRVGETTTTGWISGPVITANTAPVLYGGKVESNDGSNNAATMWNYRVTYKDVDNQPPAYVKLYIGRKDTTGELVWDAGHGMDEAMASDRVFSDGKEYVYSTRLDQSTDPYYHCFVAADASTAMAQYDATTSPSAHTIWEPVEVLSGSGKVYEFAHKPVVGNLSVPELPGMYTNPSIYVGGTLTTNVTIDLLQGTVTFASAPTGQVTAKYWFGVQGPDEVVANTPPALTLGKVVPTTGSSTTLFTFSVRYTDTDGLKGQAPEYSRLILDGRAEALTSKAGSYKEGVTYEAQMNLANGVHKFYFEASDGAGYAVFDAGTPSSRSSGAPIAPITPITGPYVNDRPILSNGLVTPNNPLGHSTAQQFVYTVKYRDDSGDAPDAGYPVVYVDNASETAYDGTVTAIGATAITDDSQNWTVDQFKGMPMQFTSAGPKATYQVFTIGSNTSNTLTILTSDLVDEFGVKVGDEFSIGKLIMTKVDADDSDYLGPGGVDYQAIVPGLGVSVGLLPNDVHTAHFRSNTKEILVGPTDAATRDTTLRFPAASELQGPKVSIQAPAGNEPPTLSNASHTPSRGTASTVFTFKVTYADPDGDAPTVDPINKVEGFVRVLIDGAPHAMTPPASPDYTAGAEFTYSSTLSPGKRNYHFEASDGWAAVRLPVSGELTVTVNYPPALGEPSITPVRGNTGMSYVYSVKYVDLNNDAPTSVKVVIDGQETDITDCMVVVPGGTYATGVVYRYTLPGGSLTEGSHTYYFRAVDALEAATPTTQMDGPSIYSNSAPAFSEADVSPASGWNTDTYTYSVVYSDPDGDGPEYVKVYVDNADADVMVKDPNENDFVTGVTYRFQKQGLGPGSHTYYFKASDYLDTVRDPASGEYNGPIVTGRPTATITIRCSASPMVGQAAIISGTVSPAMAVPLTIKFTRPSGTKFERSVSSQANGSYSLSWTPELNGTWKISTAWAGGGDYLPSSSSELTVVVAGPSLTITGLHMISLPLQPSIGYPEGCFGRIPPFALAKWQPSSGAYKLYSLLPGYASDYDFPLIAAGQAYWIKTLEPKVIAPSGSLVSTTWSFSIPIEAGWNQIGYPFLQETVWGNLQVRYNAQTVSLATAHANGWVREYAWTYDPSIRNYKLVDANRVGADRTMRPWLGYWVRALVDCQLIVPSPTGGGIEPPPPPMGGQPLGLSEHGIEGADTYRPREWTVRMIATSGELQDSAYFGQSSSKPERIESPPCLEGYVDLYFTDDERDGIYAADVRGSLYSGDSWRLRVATDSPGDVQLTWEGLESVPANARLTLVDEQNGVSLELVSGGSYTFEARQVYTSRSFRILFETK